MSKAAAADHLQHLGFTELEANVYLSLVSAGAASGYRVAARIGRPVANVYKALQSLARKGAVVEENKLHSAVDPSMLVERLEADFSSRCRDTVTALRSVPQAGSDSIAARLQTVDQVMAQARTMLGRAKSMVLVDAFPRPLGLLANDLSAAAARVVVVVQSYAAVDVPDATVVVAPDGRRLIERWHGHWLNLVVDGEQALLALIDSDFTEVHHALHVMSLPLSLLFHSGFSAEIQLNALVSDLEDGKAAREALSRSKKLRQAIASPAAIPGAMTMLAQAGEKGKARPRPTSDGPRRRPKRRSGAR